MIWDANNRGLLHFAGTGMIGDVPGSMQHVYEIADRLKLDYNRQDDSGMTPLMVAAATQMSGLNYASGGNYVLVEGEAAAERVEQYVQRGADLHAKDDLGRTALHWASITPRVSVSDVVTHQTYNVPMLLSLGADLNKVDAFGRTPLEWAIAEGNTAHAAALSSWAGADTSAPELLTAQAETNLFVGATMTFDEAVGPLSANDFVMVRDDGLTTAAKIRKVTTLAGGNTRVEFAATDRLRMLPGHWRVYAVDGGAADSAGNTYEQPAETRGRNVPAYAEMTYLPADADGDGRVGLSDFTVLRGAFNTPGTNGGDFNGDGWVNLADFAMLRRDFGVDLSAGPSGDFGGRDLAKRPLPQAREIIVTNLPDAEPGTFAVPTGRQTPADVLIGNVSPKLSFFSEKSERESLFA